MKVTSNRAAGAKAAGPFHHVMVVAMDNRPEVRQGFENDLAAFLAKRGVSGISSYSRFSLQQLQGDKDQVRQAVASTGADSVLFVRISDRRDVVKGPPASLGDMDMASVDESRYNAFTTPGGSINTLFTFQARLYQVSNAEPVWDAQLDATLKEGADPLSLTREIAGKVIAQLGKDRLVP